MTRADDFERLYAEGLTAPGRCVEWPYANNGTGYGLMAGGTRRATPRSVHVVACERMHGPRPPGMQAAHSCGRRACVNPHHLRWATPKENQADSEATRARGEKHGNARLTDAQVEEIRRRYRAGGVRQADLAAEYGVTQSHVSSLVGGRRRAA